MPRERPPTDADLAATGGRKPVEPETPPALRLLIRPEPSQMLPAPGAPPPIDLPPATADVEVFEGALRRRIVAAVMDARSHQALLDGLAADDLKERRQWWTLVLGGLLRPQKDGEAGPSVKIVMNTVGPATEDGPLRRAAPPPTIEVTATGPREE